MSTTGQAVGGAAAVRGVAPKPVLVAGVLLVVLAVLNLIGYFLGAVGFVVGGLSVSGQGDSRGTVLATTGVVVGVVVVAVFLVAVWLAVKVRHGRGWARALTTVLLVLGGAVVAVDSWRLVTADPVVIPLAGVVELVLMVLVVALLWLPASARDYFAGRRA